MKAVKPFFGPYTSMGVANTLETKGNSDSGAPNTGSSEGFTAFFTTTNSNTTNSNTTNTSSDSNSDPKTHAAPHQAGSTHEDETEASASSMVALARVKRKHLKRRHEEESSPSSSTSGGEKNPHRQEQPLQRDANDATNHDRAQEQAQAHRREQSSSSSSDEPQRQFQLPANRNMAVPEQRPLDASPPLPLVSESSTSNGSNSTSNTGTSNASGSGSNGNSGVSNKGSSGSGSGSNNGSSGSGNEEKGSGGDGNSNDENKEDDIDEKPVAVGSPALAPQQEASALSNPNAPVHSGDDGSAREKKLMDKKRKRMDMRREYEEQVQLNMESSESSDGQQKAAVLPGKPVTLDTALSFSRMARRVKCHCIMSYISLLVSSALGSTCFFLVLQNCHSSDASLPCGTRKCCIYTPHRS